MPQVQDNALERFHPAVRKWFERKFSRPTEIQASAWRLISSGEHSLISAATGSGKTLAAFLWAIDRLVSGEWERGRLGVIYLSPLKALNNDIQRNLLEPLAELQAVFESQGLPWPEIRVATRSGDTSSSDRRKLIRKPPEILITTPESLSLMLASADGQRSLMGVRTAIVDEIHSVADSKRGVLLMTGLERLARVSGEFQRIGLSATVRPMEGVARFLGGQSRGMPRPVSLAASSSEKRYKIEVRFPESANEDAPDDEFWKPIVDDLKRIIEANRSTLVFVNSRKLCEKIAYKINADEPAPIAYAHHGSLSKEIRSAVESRLKAGELKAIVATNSLEMGIDIGALDQVVMVQCPGVISSAVQKVGRAGHQVGAVSQATLFPSHSRDFLEAAVMAQAIRDRDIEPLKPMEGPLDMLAQILVSMAGPGPMDLDEAYSIFRSTYAYRDLSREAFDSVLNMLAGRYASSRLRELKPRIAIDRSAKTFSLRKGALLAYYFSGGAITDRGYFHLRMEGSGAMIGELDEEFVWERKIGDVFTLGVQSWKIDRITYNDVFVTPGSGSGHQPPFWKADDFDRDYHYTTRIGEFLEWADARVEKKTFEADLVSDRGFDKSTAKALAEFLRRQKAATSAALPHRHHILAEIVDAGPSGAPGQQLILHTPWGGRVNRPFGLALDAAWEEAFGHRTEVYVSNDCVVATLGESIDPEEVLALVKVSNVEFLLRRRLESSGFFGARFREASGAALLITRQKAGHRLPLWMSRLRAKKLLDSVKRYPDFPIMLEAWRMCLKDCFDMEGLRLALDELEAGQIEITVRRSRVASPFAASIAWRQINDQYMYATDDPASNEPSKLDDNLIRAIAFDASQRPRVSKPVIAEFESKRQRLAIGYAPTDELELKEWLRDRIAVPAEEWKKLLEASARDGESPAVSLPKNACGRSDLASDFVFLSEENERVFHLLAAEPDEDLFVEWLSYYGPVPESRIREIFQIESLALGSLIDSLSDERRVVVGALVEGSDQVCVCEAENFEALLRMQRARNRPVFEALPFEKLGPFLARRQGLIGGEDGLAGTIGAMETLTGFPERAALWEEDFFPCRVSGYQGSWLDSACLEEGWSWSGRGKERLAFASAGETEIVGVFREEVDAGLEEAIEAELLRSRNGLGFDDLAESCAGSAAEIETALWSLVWKGRVVNDAFASARRGLLGGFSIGEREVVRVERRMTGRRRSLGRSSGRSRVSYPGLWRAAVVDRETDEDDSIAALELQKDRARILLDRYGVLFRELLVREALGFQWRDVFKALRLMELSGEILAGAFFQGPVGLQFAAPDAFRSLRKGVDERAIYWMNAADPASLCGLGFGEGMPKRLATSRLVYRGSRLVFEIHRSGKDLKFHVEPGDDDFAQVVEALRHLLTRSFNSMSRIVIETINGESAERSLYLDALDGLFRLHRGHKGVVLEGVK